VFKRDVAIASALGPNMASRGHFRGVWDVRTERVVATLREVSLASSDEPSELLGRDIAEFNAALFEVYKRGCTAGAIFTLHFDAFADADLNKQFMPALRQTPARLLPFVTPRLVDIPGDAPVRLLETRVRQLQSLFRRVIVEVPVEADADRSAHLRQATFATTWDAISRAGNAERAARRFQALAKDGGHSSMMTGVDCSTSFAVATLAGFDIVAGSRIGCFEQPLADQYTLTYDQIADGD
jgi:hypothetical protein